MENHYRVTICINETIVDRKGFVVIQAGIASQPGRGTAISRVRNNLPPSTPSS